jgi:pyruvate kinase
VKHALAYLKRREWCTDDTWLVVITNALAHGKVIDSLQLRQVGEARVPARTLEPHEG